MNHRNNGNRGPRSINRESKDKLCSLLNMRTKARIRAKISFTSFMILSFHSYRTSTIVEIVTTLRWIKEEWESLTGFWNLILRSIFIPSNRTTC